jgi:hypothetical protein
MIRTIITAALLAFASAVSAKEPTVLFQMIRPTPQGTGIMLCRSAWMVSKGPEWGDIYCAIPLRTYNQWIRESYERGERKQ